METRNLLIAYMYWNQCISLRKMTMEKYLNRQFKIQEKSSKHQVTKPLATPGDIK